MEGKQLQQAAHSVACSLPGVSNRKPFTETLDVYKVADKVFLIVTDDPNELTFTVKTGPTAAPHYAGGIRRSSVAAIWRKRIG